MGKIVDLTGKKIGKLTVIKYVGQDKHNNARWLCQCECGNEVEISGTRLNCNKVKSCGCSISERASKGIHIIHNLTHTRLYNVWNGIKNRCYNKNNNRYNIYGARGIKVCNEWQEFQPFYDWAMANGYNPNAKRGECTIDRIDVNSDYCPENCRWVDSTLQAQNRKTTRNITINNETHCIKEWCKIKNINYQCVMRRINGYGWNIEKALTTPIRK